MLIQNVTDQTIGWDGVEFPPGVAVEVDDSIGEVMMERHPQKFCPPFIEPEAKPARTRRRSGQG